MTAAAGLSAAEATARLGAIEAIAARGVLAPGELEGLCGRLADDDKQVQRRAAETLAVLATASPRLDELLAECLRGGDRRARWGAAFCEAARGRASLLTLTIWIDHLASDDRDLRWAAHDLLVRHLPRVGDDGLALLRDAATIGGADAADRGGDAQRRKMALYCLRDLGRAGAVNSQDLVRAALGAAEIEVRLAAVAAYAALATDRRRAATDLCRLLGDGAGDGRVRRASAVALGKLGYDDARVRGELAAAAESSDPALCRAAGHALAALGEEGAPPSE